MNGPFGLLASIAAVFPGIARLAPVWLLALLPFFSPGCSRSGEDLTGNPPGNPGDTIPGNGRFSVDTVATGLLSPTAMQFAPDGRLFVCEQGGSLRVIKNGTLLPDPFLTVATTSMGERGLLGIAFDPAFPVEGLVYVYYTATSPDIHNRVSRFTVSPADPDRAAEGSEQILLELDTLSAATNHNGGALHFGKDGKLYVAVGDNGKGSNSQTLDNLLGKMLRLDRDGSIPADNPFHDRATGVNRAIWTLGLRNPFNFSVQPGTGRIFINDVGETKYEEINEGSAGANYGWPVTEGPSANPDFKAPFHSYGSEEGCAITGGTFYNPSTPQFPADYVGDYYFTDYCRGWIRRIDTGTLSVSQFATGLMSPVDLKVGPEGSLYCLVRGGGAVRRISYRVPDGSDSVTASSLVATKHH